jgi:uncharacterized membrane protein SirB2
LASGPFPCHDQAVADDSTVLKLLDVLSDLMGLVVGVMLLVVGIATYHDGGSVGWFVAGVAVLLINLWVAGRRFRRRRKPTPVS